MTLQEKKKAQLLDTSQRVSDVCSGTARPFKINESSGRTIIREEDEICDAVSAAMPAGSENLHFL